MESLSFGPGWGHAMCFIYLFIFFNVFYSGNVVLQVVFCHHSIYETQEININVGMCIHSFKQEHELSKSSSHLFGQMSLNTFRSPSDYAVSISKQTFHVLYFLPFALMG